MNTSHTTAQRQAPRVLVSTLAPGPGGVSAMTRFVVDTLRARGCQPVIAHYAPYSTDPALSVPSFRLLQRRPGQQLRQSYDGIETHAIGAWLPELEFTHYQATGHWRQLMDSCDAYVSVSGNVLAATAFMQTGRPYVAWVATDWHGDRKDRVKGFPWLRRGLDACVNAPVIRRLERQLLTSGKILSLSEYTASVLAGIAGPGFPKTCMPTPVDADFYSPQQGAAIMGRIGFAGRFNDPRKNTPLLVAALATLRQQGRPISAALIGDQPDASILRLIDQHGLREHVTFHPDTDRHSLRAFFQSLDLFVLPSHQEGLCIAALEAMACGLPVVSTRCGGPEEFVIPGQTGALVGFDHQEMARAIDHIVSDRALRTRLAQAARHIIEQRYTAARAEAIFWQALGTSFPALSPRNT